MQVTIQAIFYPEKGVNPVVIETNAHATVQSLISSYCSQRELAYNPRFCLLDESSNVLPLYNTLLGAGIVSGQKLYLGLEEEKTCLTRWPLYVSAAALVIGLVGIITMSLMYSLTGGVVPFDHGVVMDAGSTKTMSILYKWLGDKFNGTGCVKQEGSCTIKGGIAKADDIEGKITDIVSCSKSITKDVKPKNLPTTPLYFTATAGMRLLELSDKNKAELILSRLNDRLNETGLLLKNVTIISGSEEGLHGWTTVNFLKNTLEIEIPEPWQPVTYGALDLGGASTQIAFDLSPTDENVNNSAKMTLFGQDHYVFSKSYLCYGRDEAQRRYYALLMQSPYVYDVGDPCAPKGSVKVENGTWLFDQPCTSSKNINQWLKNDPDILVKNYTFNGESDYDKCHEMIVKLTDPVDCKNSGFTECFSKLPRQLEGEKFVAFSGFFYTMDFLKLTKSNLTDFVATVKSFCKKSMDEIHGGGEHKADYCFNAVYIHEILTTGYGFNETTWKNLEFQLKINDINVGWTLGYMVKATNSLPTKKPSKKAIAPNVLIVCLLFFIIAVVATIVYLSHYYMSYCRKGGKMDISPHA